MGFRTQILRMVTIKMTTSKNVNWQTSDWQHKNGVTALQGPKVQDVDYSSEEESYELLPSGD